MRSSCERRRVSSRSCSPAAPESAFDFNVGVCAGPRASASTPADALGTDRYPPFTLDDVGDYPAPARGGFPASLSPRAGAWSKWWLLALPQYLVVAVFTGGAWAAWSGTRTECVSSSGGLVGLLVLFAGIALLFTGRYPKSLYDLVLGMNRWVFRVAAYATLMTDVYPPFRLDMGGDEPPTETVRSTPAPAIHRHRASRKATTSARSPVRTTVAVTIGGSDVLPTGVSAGRLRSRTWMERHELRGRGERGGEESGPRG